MKCLITAGPTYEPLDKARRLTNFSTGRLGTELAAFLSARGHEVTLFRGEQATWTQPVKGTVTFTTTADLRDRLEAAAGNFDAVYHAAAVSDFSFGRVLQGGKPVEAGKISSRLEDLTVELKATPKIIAHLRDWYPHALLVGWKYEVDGGRDSAIARAREQVAQCRTDICVVNGPADGVGFGVVGKDIRHCATRDELFEQLLPNPKPGR